MKDRKGIARLALRTGTPIVPAYSFGNTQAAWEERNKQRDVCKFSTETTSFAGDRVVLILRGRNLTSLDSNFLLLFSKGFIGFKSLLNMKTAMSLNMFSWSLLDENS